MAEEPKTGGEVNPLALAGGIPAAENLAASYGMLSNISSTLMGILQNPLISATGIQQLSHRWDEHVIKRLKEIKGLTGESAAAFDRLAQGASRAGSIFSSMAGFALGAGLRIAYMNEQLERQAAMVGKYARLQDLSGGSAFSEARRMQANYYGNVATYGKAIAEQARQAEMQLNTAMFNASGIKDPNSRANFSAGMGMYNQMYGGNAGGFVGRLFTKFGARGMTLGKGQDLLEQLRLRLEGGQIYNEQGLPGIQEEFLQLAVGLGKSGMGYSSGRNLSGAANLMQAASGNENRRIGAEDRQYIYRMMSEVMMSGSQTALLVGAGLGKSPLQVARESQQRMGEDPRAVMLEVSRGVKRLIDKAGGLKSETGRYFAEHMGVGDLDQIEFLTETLPKILGPIQTMNVNYKELNNKGRVIGKEMQDRAEASKDALDVISGRGGQAATNMFGGQGMKTAGYGVAGAMALTALIMALKRSRSGGGALTWLLGASALQKLVSSPDVQGAGSGTGGDDTVSKVVDTATNIAVIRALTKTNAPKIAKVVAATVKESSVAKMVGEELLKKGAGKTALRIGAGEAGAAGLLAGLFSIPALVGLATGAAAVYLASEGIHSALGDPSIYGPGKTIPDVSTNMGKDVPTFKIRSEKEVLASRRHEQAEQLRHPWWKVWDPYKDPEERAEEAKGEGTPNQGTSGKAGEVFIHIVGPNGEDYGEGSVGQGEQRHFRVNMGMVLGLNGK